MVDAQVPFADVFESAISQGSQFVDAWNRAAVAASSASKATADLIPKMGRARVLGEKSVGFQDPGATSFSLIVSTISSMFK
jgi:dihydroxyacetone kinase